MALIKVFVWLIGIWLLLEFLLHLLLARLRLRFRNVIITGKDRLPKINQKELSGFFTITETFFSTRFDAELGWTNVPNTENVENSFSGKTTYHIDARGVRVNPGHEHLPSRIGVFGDSLAFCRNVNDNQTWEYFLSGMFHCNVENYGVGNYGLDQSFLRFKREHISRDWKTVIIAVVPETLRRNLSVWKHYNEFGNIFAFKPRFKLYNGKMKLVPNIIDSKEKFFELEKYISRINDADYFYKNKFQKYLFTFPYIFSIMKNPKTKMPLLFYYGGAYILELLRINWKKIKVIPKHSLSFDLADRKKYYREESIVSLSLIILKEFAEYAGKKGLKAVFAIIPEYDDLLYIQKTGDVYYRSLLDSAGKFMPVCDLSVELLKAGDIDSIFGNKSYGGHYNEEGNRIIAKTLHKLLEPVMG